MMECKLLTERADLELYAQIGNAAYGVGIPFEYFTKGKTLGFFKDGKMVGGAAIITQGPFRSIELIPAEQRKSCGIDSVPLEEIVEINAVWLLPEVSSLSEVVRFWFRIVTEVRKTGRTRIVIPYNKSADGLDRLYKPLGMKPLFSGGGAAMSTHKNIMVGMCTMSDIYKGFMVQATKRFVRARILLRPARGAGKTKPTDRISA